MIFIIFNAGNLGGTASAISLLADFVGTGAFIDKRLTPLASIPISMKPSNSMVAVRLKSRPQLSVS